MSSGSAQNAMSYGSITGPIGTGGQASAYDVVKQFLGDLPTHKIPNVSERVKYVNYDLAEAYAGRNLFLEERVTGLILEPNSWYTTICLPWLQTDQIYFEWSTWNFDLTYADIVPNEGVSRMIESSKRSERAQTRRRGLAMLMEYEFYTTPEGKTHYNRNLQSIASSVQETQNADTINALLHCKDYRKIWQQLFGASDVTIDAVSDQEINTYACTIKDETRLDFIIQEWLRLFGKQNIKPDMLIMWPGAKIYLSMVASVETYYYTVGEGQRLIQNRGPDALGEFRTLKVFETKDFDIYMDSQIPVQLLTRVRSIGERYNMFCSQFRDTRLDEFQTSMRDIFWYDETKDDFVRMRFIDAFRQSGIFENFQVKGHSPTENKNTYSKHMKELLERHNKDNRDYSDQYMKDFINPNSGVLESNKGPKGKSFPPHFLFHQTKTRSQNGQSKNQWHFNQYFGQIHSGWIRPEDWRQMAYTLLNKMPGDSRQHYDDWSEMMTLIAEIENQSYENEYWKALVEINFTNSKGVGQTTLDGTSPEFVKKWNQNILEWQPNKYGSLDLPDWKKATAPVRDVKPSGFSNYPGLKTLASHADDVNSYWQSFGQRAVKAVNIIEKIVRELGVSVPNSENIQKENRPPWFHRPDAETTFFENAISTAKDPVFLKAKLTAATTEKKSAKAVARSAKDFLAASIKIAFEDINTSVTSSEEKKILTQFWDSYVGSTKFSIMDFNALVFGLNNTRKTNSNSVSILLEKFKNVKSKQKGAAAKLADEYNFYISLGHEQIEKDATLKLEIESLNPTTASLKEYNEGVAEFFRAPLSFSYSLVPLPNDPLVLPGNPATRFQTPVDVGSVTNAKSFQRILVNKRIQTKSMVDVVTNPTLRKLSDHTFVQALISSKSPKVDISKDSKQVSFQEEEEYSDGSDDEVSLFTKKKIGDIYRSTPGERREMSKEHTKIQKEDSTKVYDEIQKNIVGEMITAEFESNCMEAMAGRDKMLCSIIYSILTSKCDTEDAWLSYMKNDIFVPINILLWRIMITHDMDSAIMMVSGQSTGANAYGHTNFALSADGGTKMLYGNYTFHSKAIVWREENVAILEDLHPHAYRGGHNSLYMEEPKDLDFEANEPNSGKNMRSVIATVVPSNEEPSLKIMSITGKVNAGSLVYTEQNQYYHYSTAELTIIKFQLQDYIEKYSTIDPNDSFLTRGNRFNTTAYLGTHATFYPKQKAYTKWTLCQGHRGPNGSYPGCASVWSNFTKLLKEFDERRYVLT